MDNTEIALKKVEDLNLQYIITLLACSYVEKTQELKDCDHPLYLYDTVIPYKETFIGITTQRYLEGCSVYIMDSKPIIVFSFYQDRTYVFRDGPWVDFIVDLYNKRLEKRRLEEDKFEEEKWQPIDL